MLEVLGETPLPRLIKRKPDEDDRERFQTVYAKHEGAVAAPTAGFHFSKNLIKRLEVKGIRIAETTLHTGLSTFRPIEVEDLTKNKMDAEYYRVDEEACAMVNKARLGKHRICSVGTTTMRALESSYTSEKLLKPSEGWTNYVHPPTLSIQYRRFTDYQFSSSKNRSLNYGVCICGLRSYHGSIQKSD